MKVLFVHDGTLKYDITNGKYFGTAVTPNSLSRYKYLSDDISIMIRTYPFKEGESRDRYTEIPTEYNIIHVDNYMNLKGWFFERSKVKELVRATVQNMDLVICRFSGETGKIAARICQEINKPYIVECVGCQWDAFWNYNWKGKILAPFMAYSQRQIIKQAPYVIYVTNQFLQKRYPTNGKSIGASNVELLPMDEANLQKRINKINSKSDRIFTLGTASAIDVPYKGQAYVMKAMSILKKEGYNIKYQIAGAGSKTYLENIAKRLGVENDVQFVGVLPHAKVFEWVDDLDLYIQPSDQEGLPRALIEAMSRACPAIGSSTAGIPELLDKEAIFKRKHVDELIKVMRLMLDKQQFLKHAKLNFETALSYQRDVIYQRRNKFYDMVLKEQNLVK
ncbi:MAG: glycosyltransferase family 4 protein [Paludibacteraceae bacterium]|nr:glycosyltransferase family 4 protein [Paludibacteraceae bacterium]